MKFPRPLAVLALVLLAGRLVNAAPAAPPNFIVIQTEDLGYHDVGFNGCRDIPTPHLDAIATHGVRFTSGYVTSPLTSPGRAGWLTGRYQARFGYERNPEWQPGNPAAGLPLTETTLADALGQAGYATGLIGKWHLGSHPALHPLRRGFQEFFGFLGAGHRYLPEELLLSAACPGISEDQSWHLRLLRNRDEVVITNYLTDEFSTAAVEFVARHQAHPFFLYLAYNAPHGPLEAPDRYLKRFPQILGPQRRTYAAMVSAVDDGVGHLLAELRQDGLVERTLLVFMAASSGGLEANSSDNYPLRGSKDYPWEGGWRVPFVMQWPGHLPQGLVYAPPVISLDLFATFTALAGVPPRPAVPLDGVNLLPYLTGQTNAAPHDALYLRMPDRGAVAVRAGDYKSVIPGKDQPAELYNVTRDPGELKNLAPAEPAILQALTQKQLAWTRQMMSPGSLGNPGRTLPQTIDTEQGH